MNFFLKCFCVVFSLFLIAVSAFSDEVMQQYLNKEEPAYEWTVHDETTLFFPAATVTTLRLVSQTWRDMDWTHQLDVIVPPNLSSPVKSFMLVNDGDNANGEPEWDNDLVFRLLAAQIANDTNSIVTILYQIPNQPLFEGRSEDALIAYTFDQYLQTGDDSWPLLLPMVKSAIKAMDAVQEFRQGNGEAPPEEFVLFGASKRGWTTWLAGALDSRVTAIVPAFYDNLDLAKQMDYQLEVWGDYSTYIQDYVDYNIPQQVHSDEGRKLMETVDPYFYLDSLQATTLVMTGTNDPYWPLDAIKFYYEDLPKPNYIRYFANMGHGDGDILEMVEAMLSFYEAHVKEVAIPELFWSVVESENSITLDFSSTETFENAKVWRATSDTRDFRGADWASEPLSPSSGEAGMVEIIYPAMGYEAFFVEVEVPISGGDPFTVCTRVYVVDQNSITSISEWIYY